MIPGSEIHRKQKFQIYKNSYSNDKNCTIYYNSIEITTNYSDDQIHIDSNVVQIRYPSPGPKDSFIAADPA